MIVQINDDDFQQLVEDDASDFDPADYGIDFDVDDLINGGQLEVVDWARVDSRGRDVTDDHVEIGGEG